MARTPITRSAATAHVSQRETGLQSGISMRGCRPHRRGESHLGRRGRARAGCEMGTDCSQTSSQAPCTSQNAGRSAGSSAGASDYIGPRRAECGVLGGILPDPIQALMRADRRLHALAARVVWSRSVSGPISPFVPVPDRWNRLSCPPGRPRVAGAWGEGRRRVGAASAQDQRRGQGTLGGPGH